MTAVVSAPGRPGGEDEGRPSEASLRPGSEALSWLELLAVKGSILADIVEQRI